jgi:hypothetical protein
MVLTSEDSIFKEKKMKGFVRTIFLLMLFLAEGLFAQIIPGGVSATPTNYEVTILKIEFRNANGSYVIFDQGSFTFDIASVNSAQTIGNIGKGKALPNGTYNTIRLTLSRTFGLTGSVADAGGGQPARTNAGNGSIPAPPPYGGIGEISLATTDGAPGIKQSVTIPNGPDVVPVLASMGMSFDAQGNLVCVYPIPSFTVSGGTVNFSFSNIDFSVVDGLEFLTTGVGQAIVCPAPPEVTIR